MDVRSIIGAIADFTTKALPAIQSGVAEVVELAQSGVKLIDTIKADLPTTAEQRQELQTQRDELERAVNAHIDKTTAALRG